MNKQHSNDLTSGSVLKHLITFSIPLLLGNLLQALYNTVDSIWVGRFIGAKALGAVSVSFPIIMILVSLVLGITMATTVLVSQYAGAKNQQMISKTINNSLLLLGGGAIIVTLVGLAFSEKILILMNTPKDILDYATDYLNIFFIGLIFMFGYNVISSILRGLGDSKTPLKFLIISTVTNLILDPIFILGIGPFPQMGIQGAALATMLSQSLSFFLALRHLNKTNHVISFKLKDLKYDAELTAKIFKIGLPSGIQQIVVSLGMVVMTGIINTFGSETVAAFGAASRLDQFAFMPAMSLGLAVSTLAGQSIGAGKNDRLKEVYKWGSIAAILVTGVTTIFVMAAPTFVLKLFTTDIQVLETGSRYLRIVGISYVPFALSFVINGMLRGAGDTVSTMIFSIASLWLIRVPLAKFLSSYDSLGSNGIWIAMAVSSILSLVMSQVYYSTGRWKNKSLIKKPALQETA
ncbi:MATE family efflux transporter [Geosporobacter ferrireducens]|uniref:Probable multidrug resistance protein NorM n=1 Tax=Geosporobacter ferrireducens TaxID=1424294 RepID=A0A1D8GKR4_9FIRM|nr:MATE family efflux transporter [Geosporobacter ferrireducens]AOT71499.1 MATE family efflux transporter [Geosporobacter ferrireducens]MTI57811.1 MATE family efflux transporter [Geosporobacter ferrireducens]